MKRRKTNTFWTRTLAAARETERWTVVPRTYSPKMAKQLTYDIRALHRRKNPGVSGSLPGEVWDAVYEVPETYDKDWNCTVAVKLLRRPE